MKISERFDTGTDDLDFLTDEQGTYACKTCGCSIEGSLLKIGTYIHESLWDLK